MLALMEGNSSQAVLGLGDLGRRSSENSTTWQHVCLDLSHTLSGTDGGEACPDFAKSPRNLRA